MPFWRCCRYLRGKDKQSDIERWSPKLQLSCFPWFSEQSCCFGTRWTGIKSSSSRQTHWAICKLDNIVNAVSGYSHGWTDCTAGAEVAALGHFHAYCQCDDVLLPEKCLEKLVMSFILTSIHNTQPISIFLLPQSLSDDIHSLCTLPWHI